MSTENQLNQNSLLTEYQQIRGEIDGHFKSRISILAIVVSSIGVILGITGKIESIYQILALYLIINVGATLTYTLTNNMRQKSAYIKVFIEDNVKEMCWFSALEIGEPLPPIVSTIFSKLKIPSDIYPRDYPFVYLILDIIISAFSVPLTKNCIYDPILIIVVFGNLFLINTIISIQHAESVNKYKSFIKFYKSIHAKLNVKGD